MTESAQLYEIVILLLAAVAIVAMFRASRLSPVLGYLTAGMVIGPFGLKLADATSMTSGFAEFGVIFLLFLIGLELSFERLLSMRKHVFGFGGAQVLLTGCLYAIFLLGLGGQASAAIIVGGGLALSSTAIVLQVLNEQGERSSQVGRLALAVLILQDLAVIPLLVLVPLLHAHHTSLLVSLGEAGMRAIIGLALIFIIGRVLLRPTMRFVASLESTELFTATTMLVALGAPFLSHMAGLSPALGAFMAGLLMAETEFKPQVEADILPFKGLFLGLFFMTVGMSIDLGLLGEHFFSILTLAFLLMTTKAVIIIVLCHLFGFTISTAVHTGLLLSQGGEFAFVLFGLAGSENILDGTLVQILLVVVTLSMALTPLVAQAGKRIAARLERYNHPGHDLVEEEVLDLRNHIIIAGYGRIGHTVARLLETEHIRFVAIDTDALLVSKERKVGIPVYYGDTTRVHVLNALSINRARAVIITHNDMRVSMLTVGAIREVNKTIPIIARAKNIDQVLRLEKAGATLAVAEMFETSLQMGGALLRSLGVSDYEISRIIDIFRAEDYALTRTAENESITAV